ncbi:DUF4398 domain-containing protein [Novilysobacter erysipheiresistens]|uniref:DUF4398 domain-containing protein n=1 Tax=Novilysobacter erysipheiresistens TaxID=1749332 RepID=A0ABU7YYZ8_9GAMM
MSMHTPLVESGVRLPLQARRQPDHNGRAKNFRHGSPMHRSFAQIRNFLLGTGLACAISACATLPPPTAELNNAQQAVVRATGADADQYASAEIATARGALTRAQAAMAEGREDDARNLAKAAWADADLAHALSREALATAELAQRRAEVEHLQKRLQGEGSR